MRLLILCLLIYLGYLVFKKLVLPGQAPPRSSEQEDLSTVDDVMVKDPFCQTYIAKKQGIKSVINGETYYFCSNACRDKYLESKKQTKR